MAKHAKRKRGRHRRHEALVHTHLERVSRDLLEDHTDVVRRFIGRNAGVYALYKKNRLCYVGLASGLGSRLSHHLRDRHGDSWDHFSIYLTIKDQHIKEIESLLLQIARPPGNRVGGKPAGSKDMRPWIEHAIREKQKAEVISLFPGLQRSKASIKAMLAPNGKSELARLLPQGARLRGTLKENVYKATVRRDGSIKYNGNVYWSLSSAAVAAIKRPTDGWWFWQVERGPGHWVRLKAIRKAGTPIYAK